MHAVIVQNMITKALYVSSRHRDTDKGIIKEFSQPDEKARELPDALKNGSILKVVLNGWFDPREMEKLSPVDAAGRFKLDGI